MIVYIDSHSQIKSELDELLAFEFDLREFTEVKELATKQKCYIFFDMARAEEQYENARSEFLGSSKHFFCLIVDHLSIEEIKRHKSSPFGGDVYLKRPLNKELLLNIIQVDEEELEEEDLKTQVHEGLLDKHLTSPSRPIKLPPEATSISIRLDAIFDNVLNKEEKSFTTPAQAKAVPPESFKEDTSDLTIKINVEDEQIYPENDDLDYPQIELGEEDSIDSLDLGSDISSIDLDLDMDLDLSLDDDDLTESSSLDDLSAEPDAEGSIKLDLADVSDLAIEGNESTPAQDLVVENTASSDLTTIEDLSLDEESSESSSDLLLDEGLTGLHSGGLDFEDGLENSSEDPGPPQKTQEARPAGPSSSSRELELENKLEILKMDSQLQLKSREQKILELKRRIDTLEFNIQLVKENEAKVVVRREEIQDKLDRVTNILRHALEELEQDQDSLQIIEDASMKLKKTI